MDSRIAKVFHTDMGRPKFTNLSGSLHDSFDGRYGTNFGFVYFIFFLLSFFHFFFSNCFCFLFLDLIVQLMFVFLHFLLFIMFFLTFFFVFFLFLAKWVSFSFWKKYSWYATAFKHHLVFCQCTSVITEHVLYLSWIYRYIER